MPESLKTIESEAFYGCSVLKNYTLPSELTTIGASAFQGCTSLTSLTLPENVTYLGSAAFYGCSKLSDLTIESDVITCGSSSSTWNGYPLYYGRYFWGTSISRLTLGENITAIPDYLFCYAGFEEGTEITLPASVQSIGAYAFAGAGGISRIVFPSSCLKSIGNNAFYNCNSLANLSIPATVTSINDEAFKDCSNLRRIDIPDQQIAFGKNVFSGDTKASFYVVPDSSAYTYLVDNGFADQIVTAYSLSYELYGGNNNAYNPGAYTNTEVIAFKEPSRRGYTFGGWYEDAGFTTEIKSTAGKTGALTIYAKWIPFTYSMKFEANFPADTTAKASSTAVADITGILSSQDVTIPSCTYECMKYVFKEWNTSADGTGTAYRTGMKVSALSEEDGATVTLYAQWVPTPVDTITLSEFRIKLNTNEIREVTAVIAPDDAVNKNLLWSSSNTAIATVAPDSADSSKATVKAVADGTALITASAADGNGCIAECLVIVGKAKPQYSVRFMNNGTEIYSETVNSGETVKNVPSAKADNSVFVGWYIDGTKWDASTPVNSYMTLEARFIDKLSGKDKNETLSGCTALDTQPDFTTDSVVLVKGQKFSLNGEWESSNASLLSVSKKGDGTAKNTTSSTIEIRQKENGAVVKKYDVTIVQPSLQKSANLVAGETKQLALSSYGGLNVTWVSSAPDVASVSPSGEVSGISKGSSIITAYINGIAFSCKVRVKDSDTSKRDFMQTEAISLVPMQSVTAKAPGFKANNAVWSSDQTPKSEGLASGVVYEDDVVRITNKGVITAIGVGTTKLRSTGGGTDLNFTVEVQSPATQIIHMNKGTSKTIKLYGTKGNLSWTSSDTSILNISGNKIKGLKCGFTTLTTKYENIDYTVIVYVEDPSITSDGILGKSPKYTLSLKKGQTLVLGTEHIYQNVIFKSNKNSIAFVDEAGVLTARGKGKAVITTKINGKKITLNVNVSE